MAPARTSTCRARQEASPPPARTSTCRARQEASPPPARTSTRRARETSPPPSPSPSPTKKRRGRQSRKKANNDPSLPTEPLTASALLSRTKQTTEEWLHARRTTKAYASHVRGGKAWLKDWVAVSRNLRQERDQTQEEEETPRPEEVPDLDPALAGAFDVIGEQTPTALMLFTSFKCEQEGCKYATAEGIRSAFKDYFEQVYQCYGEYWKYNTQTEQWEGNPVFESKYRNYYDSLKNRDNKTETTQQSLPMLPSDLEIIMKYLDSAEGNAKYSKTRRLFFKAFASTAFTLWTRNEEMVNLKYSHVFPKQTSAGGEPYIKFRLVFRKTNKDPNKYQDYLIPPEPDMPHIDCYTHMHNWLDHLQSLLPRKLQDDDPIFPAISSTGGLKFGEGPISRSAFETLLENIVKDSGVLEGRNGNFTTHCFRRGGCQYRFMWAPIKWSLRAVKWWGGWSSNDNVGTITRYLLDELMAYEESYGDIMLRKRPFNRHEIMDDATAAHTVSNARLDELSQKVDNLGALLMKTLKLGLTTGSETEAAGLPIAKALFDKLSEFQSILENFGSSPVKPPYDAAGITSTPQSSPARPQRHPSFDGLESSPVRPCYGPERQATPQVAPMPYPSPPRPITPPSPRSPPPASHFATRNAPGRIPKCDSLDQAIKYWEKGSDAAAIRPLKDWEMLYPDRKMWGHTEVIKYTNVKSVVTEFEGECNGDRNVFEARYPGLSGKYTELYKAIRNAKIARGETKARSPKKPRNDASSSPRKRK